MRQIGDDLRTDPREPIVAAEVAEPELNATNAAALAQFSANKLAEMSHKYCSRSLNMSAAKMSEVEKQRWGTCLKKYEQTLSLYKEEQGVFFSALAAIDRVGGDRYAKLNEYDKF